MAQNCVNTNDQNIVLYLEKKLSTSCMQDIKTTFKKWNIFLQNHQRYGLNEDHAIFLKYCTQKIYKCYHAMANDTSYRPYSSPYLTSSSQLSAI